MYERDMLQPIPEDLAEKYDIVHIRFFLPVVFGKDPVPIVNNFLKLLKPGGWICWGEYDLSLWHTIRTSDCTLDEMALWQQIEYAGSFGGTKPSWTETYWPKELPKFFAEEKLVNITADNRLFPPELLSYNLDVSVVSCTELIEKVFDAMGGGHSEAMRSISEKVFAGRRQICQNYGRLSVIAQKPMPK